MTAQPGARGGPGLLRWDPLRSLGSMDPFRVMREFLSLDPFSEMQSMMGGMGAMNQIAFAPDIEVKETKDGYMICADVPGLKEEDVTIDVAGNRLSISGKREEEQRDEGDRYWAYERSFGSFSRSFTLPEGVNPEQIDARLDKGVLSVHIPKVKAEEPKRIQVKGTEQTSPSTAATSGQTPQGASQTQPQGSATEGTTQGGSREKAA